MKALFIIIELAVFALALAIFIESNKELWDEMGKDIWNELKSKIAKWFKNTNFWMWYINRKNGVKILSEKEYQRIVLKNMNRTKIIRIYE